MQTSPLLNSTILEADTVPTKVNHWDLSDWLGEFSRCREQQHRALSVGKRLQTARAVPAQALHLLGKFPSPQEV